MKTTIGRTVKEVMLGGAGMIILFGTLFFSGYVANAQTAAPVIGIQSAESESKNCTVKPSNIMYSNGIDWTTNNVLPPDAVYGKSWPGQDSYADASTQATIPPGDTDCNRLWLSGLGPFTSDFRVGVRMLRKYTDNVQPMGWGQWEWTDWASGAGSLYNYGNGWSLWAADLANAGSDPGYSYYQVAVDTRPLPPGEQVSIYSVNVQNGDYDYFGKYNPGAGCGQPPGEQDEIAYAYDAGWTIGGHNGTGWTAASDVADCIRVSLVTRLKTLSATPVTDNIPSTMTPGQVVTTGTDGKPLWIEMQNSGDPWMVNYVALDPTAPAPQGTCVTTDSSGIPAPSLPGDASSAGASCTSGIILSNASDTIQHVSSDFAVSQSGNIMDPTQVTVTSVFIPGSYVPPDPSCLAATPPQYQSEFCPGYNIPDYSGYSYTYNPYVYTAKNYFFPIASITAPMTAGSYTEQWQMAESGFQFPTRYTKNITVGNAAGGTITVKSVNANDQSIGVPAQWDLSGNVPGGFVCSAAQGLLWNGNVPCTGTEQTYSGLPANNDTYGLSPSTVGTSAHYYSMKEFEQVPIAKKKTDHSLADSIAASLRNVFSTVAEAIPTISPNAGAILTSSSPSATLVILWNPVAADMTLSTGAISLDAYGSTSQPVTITAIGAPTAQLDWTESVSTSDGGSWLSVAPTSGSITIGATNTGTGSATISASGASNGTHTGTVTFKGYNHSDGTLVSTKTVSVTYSVVPVTVSCDDTSVDHGGTTTCHVTGGTGSGYTFTATGDGSIDPTSGVFTAGATAGTAVVTAKDSGGNVSQQVTITVTNPACDPVKYPGCKPSVTLVPIPPVIVVPETAVLEYHVSHATDCVISGGGFGSGTPVDLSSGTVNADGSHNASGTTSSFAPTQTTTYTMECENTNYSSNNSTTLTVQLQVGGIGRCETNPNGVGCPGQQ